MTRASVAGGLAVVMLLLSACASIRSVGSRLTGPPALDENAFARKRITTYRIPDPPDATVVGKVGSHRIRSGETFFDVARYYDLGYNEIVEANPGVDPLLPPVGASVVLPTSWILPCCTYDGIVVNVPEMRLSDRHRAHGLADAARQVPHPPQDGESEVGHPGVDPPGAHQGIRRRSSLDRRGRSRQSPRQVPHGAVAPALQHPRDGRALGDRHAGDARLRAALPGGHPAALPARAGRHARRVRLPAGEGGTARRRGLRRGPPRRLPLRRPVLRPRARGAHPAGARRGCGRRPRQGRAPELDRHAISRLAGRRAGPRGTGGGPPLVGPSSPAGWIAKRGAAVPRTSRVGRPARAPEGG
ncbi:MAG: LysM peptidoglycan-binding domain-containing protein [Deltaproteobacteria bacterium]|nr:MAG: LysM peptidoglycan-binding domain-containing protein [Deltaproteobacteria bacterium]